MLELNLRGLELKALKLEDHEQTKTLMNFPAKEVNDLLIPFLLSMTTNKRKLIKSYKSRKLLSKLQLNNVVEESQGVWEIKIRQKLASLLMVTITWKITE